MAKYSNDKNGPAPITKTALLPSVGYGPGVPRITKHTWVATRKTRLPGDGEAWEFIFRCAETGADRRWGTMYLHETVN